ncbi:hypothetical protein VTK73DRAFT_3068 [Phialemonium thermophilum]|uniref:Uncharacterized protein n=1 Tax=Phialemonium thermophilum TaxID=223376 RepID=A0ABR3VLM4_9PEZI
MFSTDRLYLDRHMLTIMTTKKYSWLSAKISSPLAGCFSVATPACISWSVSHVVNFFTREVPDVSLMKDKRVCRRSTNHIVCLTGPFPLYS